MSKRDHRILSARLSKARRDLERLYARDQGETMKALALRWFIEDAEGWLDEVGVY